MKNFTKNNIWEYLKASKNLWHSYKKGILLLTNYDHWILLGFNRMCNILHWLLVPRSYGKMLSTSIFIIVESYDYIIIFPSWTWIELWLKFTWMEYKYGLREKPSRPKYNFVHDTRLAPFYGKAWHSMVPAIHFIFWTLRELFRESARSLTCCQRQINVLKCFFDFSGKFSASLIAQQHQIRRFHLLLFFLHWVIYGDTIAIINKKVAEIL